MPEPQTKRMTDEHLKGVCKFGQGEATCAFLTMGSGGMECGKGTFVEATIRMRLETGDMRAKGDNCDGLPEFNAGACELGRTFCQNAVPIKGQSTCSMCSNSDMANCQHDPDPHPADCRGRCTRPEGPCDEGQTYYEQLGLVFH